MKRRNNTLIAYEARLQVETLKRRKKQKVNYLHRRIKEYEYIRLNPRKKTLYVSYKQAQEAKQNRYVKKLIEIGYSLQLEIE